VARERCQLFAAHHHVLADVVGDDMALLVEPHNRTVAVGSPRGERTRLVHGIAGGGRSFVALDQIDAGERMREDQHSNRAGLVQQFLKQSTRRLVRRGLRDVRLTAAMAGADRAPESPRSR
jgi:hypothetical protein